MPRVVLELSDEVLSRLDRLAQERMKQDTPLSQQEWLMTTPTGKELWRRIAANLEFNHLDVDSLNALIRAKYLEHVGSVRIGRPPISEYRVALLEEAFKEYIKPRSDVDPKLAA